MSRRTARRDFLGAAAGSAMPFLLGRKIGAEDTKTSSLIAEGARAESGSPTFAAAAARAPRPLVHVCDLYRPHLDLDDHWDLATAYAMTYRGDLELRGILVDHPENARRLRGEGLAANEASNPDIAAVAQLNYLTDRAVPIATGTIWPTKPGEKVREDNLPKELNGVNMLLDILERSSQPVVITVVGSCQDVAIAGKKAPRLFAKKCAGIYVSAGVGSQNPKELTRGGDGSSVEHNVFLNRGAYATMFELPCPIYWMPCFDSFSGATGAAGEYGSFWRFRQTEVLAQLSARAQAYFAYVFGKESGGDWLSYLLDSRKKSIATPYFEIGMWSTAGFIHAAGKTVSIDGEIVPQRTAGDNALYEFIPIEVRCDEKGLTTWRKTRAPTHRYIFRVRDQKKYFQAMATPLKTMLLALP